MSVFDVFLLIQLKLETRVLILETRHSIEHNTRVALILTDNIDINSFHRRQIMYCSGGPLRLPGMSTTTGLLTHLLGKNAGT